MLRSGNHPAYFTILSTALALGVTPIDVLLTIFEKRLYKIAPPRKRPIILVCGTARSGTTIVHQVLAKHLPVAYIPNITSVLPRSTVTVSRILQFSKVRRKLDFKNYYGKTASLTGPNDANHLWVRWVETDKLLNRTILNYKKKDEIRNFFNAYELIHNLPILCKYNTLNTFAHDLIKILENVYFIYVNREPLYLGQSLLLARRDIQGDFEHSYGVDDPNREQNKVCFLDQIVQQVQYNQSLAVKQQHNIGTDHFWVVSYEDFCVNPGRLVFDINDKILKSNSNDLISQEIEPIHCRNERKINPILFRQLQEKFESANITPLNSYSHNVENL